MELENIVTQHEPLASFDNQIRTEKNILDEKIITSETSLFGADQVFVGVKNIDETEIATNKDGFKYERNKVESVEIYNLHKQAHHCWLMIDLETGGRGWYPGSKEVVDVSSNTILYSCADDSSAQVFITNEDSTFDKLDLVYGISSETTKKIVYCKVLYNDTECFIKNSKIIKTKFVNK